MQNMINPNDLSKRAILIAALTLVSQLACVAQTSYQSPDDNWDPQFDLSGVIPFGGKHYVSAVGYLGADLYVGGFFDAVGQTRANSIARWDGTRWHPLGAGLQSGDATPVMEVEFLANVLAIAGAGTNLYVGGDFKVAGDQYANHIACWDGASWHALGPGIWNGVQYGSGTGGYVKALLAVANDLYVGGWFTNAGGIPAAGIAKWDGTQWSALGGGLDGGVYAIAKGADGLYVGGAFDTAGGVPAANIAKWDGTNWTALGGGLGWSQSSSYLRATVNSIVILGTKVYVSGFFDLADGNYAPGFAEWDGSRWSGASQMANGDVFQIVAYSTVTDYGTGPLAVLGNTIYMAGNFLDTNHTQLTGLARLETNNTWTIMATGIGWPFTDNTLAAYEGMEGNYDYIPILSAASDGARIALGGDFDRVNQQSAVGIVLWNGQNLTPLCDGGGNGVDGWCRALATGGTNVFAGIWGQAGGLPVNGIARWDGKTWSNLGDGVQMVNSSDGMLWSGEVWAIAATDTEVYAGGNFTVAGSIYANSIAKWDGASWSALGNGVNNGLRSKSADRMAIAIDGSNVFVGGSFTNAGGIAANNIARWDGTRWSALGTGTDYGVNSLAIGPDGLYAGGSFGTAGGIASSGIARWDGSAWHSLAGGIRGIWVEAVQNHRGEIWIGGSFTKAGENPAGNVAKWNGTNWMGIPATTYLAGDGTWSLNEVWCLASDGRDLYMGGNFIKFNPRSELAGVAKFTSNGWVLLGRGLGTASACAGDSNPLSAQCLTILGRSLYVASGGYSFQTAGNTISMNFARYDLGRDLTGPWIESVQVVSGGLVQCSAKNVNATNALWEATSGFSDWTPIGTAAVTNGGTTFIDSNAPTTHRFYRVALP
jgi:hypothetical protein